MATGPHLSIITLNVNGLNAKTKRQRLAEWIQKQDPYICCLQETHLKTRDTYRLKVKGWKKIFHANGDQQKAGVAMLSGRLQAYLKKEEKSQINNLTLHLKQLEKEEMKNPRVKRRKEILKIRAEINAKETKETIQTKSEGLEKNISRKWRRKESGSHNTHIR